MYAIKDAHKLLERIYYSIDLHVCRTILQNAFQMIACIWRRVFRDAHGEWFNAYTFLRSLNVNVVNIFRVVFCALSFTFGSVFPYFSGDIARFQSNMLRIDTDSRIEYKYGVTVFIAGSHETLMECVVSCYGWWMHPSDDTKFQSNVETRINGCLELASFVSVGH